MASSSAFATSAPPLPPSAHTREMRAGTPSFAHASMTVFTSASVSAVK